MVRTFTVTLASAVLLFCASAAQSHAALINHWAFDGTGNDTGSNNMDVTLLNGATYAAGQFGQALSLDGVDDYANRASSAPLTSDGTFTISAWAYQLDATPVDQRYISWGTAGARAFMGPFSNGSGQITAGIGSTSASFTDASAVPLQNTWQHWAFVRSGTSASLYLDGSLVQTLSVAVSGSVNATNELHIGRQYGTFGEYFRGRLDDVAIWNEALNLEQIQNVMSFGAANFNGISEVPEPSTAALHGLGLVGLAVRRRQSRYSKSDWRRSGKILKGAVALLTFTMLSATASPARAAILTFVGEDNQTAWQSSSVPKAHDTNGNNILGQAGYVWYATKAIGASTGCIAGNPLTFDDGTHTTQSSLPAYLSLANNGQNQVCYFNYPEIDDPNLPSGPTVANVHSGLAIRQTVTKGTENSVLDFNIDAEIPEFGLRISVAALNSGVGDSIETVRLTQTVGGAATATATRSLNTGSMSFYSFDLSDAQIGDRFTLYLAKSAGQSGNDNLPYFGILFDQKSAPVPEPTTGLLLAVGLLAACLRRRNRLD